MSVSFKSQLAPKSLEFKSSEMIISDKYCAILTIISYPKSISEGYLAKYAAKLKELGFVEKAYPLASAGDGVQLYKDGVYARVTNVL